MKKYEFPIGIHGTKLIKTLAEKSGLAKQGSKLNLLLTSALYKQVFDFLMKNYGDIIEMYKCEKQAEGQEIENLGKSQGIIWTCWWQGEDNAPPLVKRCIESVRNNAGDHEVVVIDQNNVHDYVDFPRHIIEKHDAKMMPTALLCDSLRATLLAKYGGLWLDATIFCLNKIPDYIWDMPLYNNRASYFEKWHGPMQQFNKEKPHIYAPFMPFTTVSVLGGHAGHPLYCISRDILERYWERYSTLMIYNLFSSTMKLACSTIDAVRRDADAIPISDKDRYKLSVMFKAADKAYDPNEIEVLVNNGTLFYKLNWKRIFSEYTVAGEETAYKRFLEGTLV